MRRVILVVATTLVAAACEPALGPGPDEPSEWPGLAISDGMHEGNGHFFFLPPLVPEPTYGGTFDASLSPLVRITQGTSTIAELVPVLNLEDEQYHANWHTDEYDLDPALTYRISVEADGWEVGYADVDVVLSGGELRNVETGEYIPLKDGRTLPIKFRIEDGFGPTGTIYYHKYVDGDYDLYRMDLSIMVEVPVLATPSWERYPVVSEDGSMIAFASNANVPRSQLAIMNADGTRLVHLPSTLDQVDPADWVGDRILLRAFEPWGSGGGAWEYSINSGLFSLIHQEANRDVYPGRAWLDETSLILPSSTRYSGTGGALRRVFRDGSSPITLWSDPNAYATANASLSPDKSQLVFEYGTGAGAQQAIYLRDMATGAVDRLASPAYSAVWSPDGRFVLFRRGSEVWLTDLRGREKVLFSDGQARHVSSWMPTASEPPGDGLLSVVVNSVGSNPDPNGYMVSLDDGPGSLNVAANGAVAFSDVAAGIHAVTLTDIASNCVVSGVNPRSAIVLAGATTSVTLEVSCTDGAIVLADDFDDGTFVGSWTVDNASWIESNGALISGPSCQNAVYCAEGLAIIRSPAFAVGDGMFTLEFDTFHDLGGAVAGHSDLSLGLQNDIPVTCGSGGCSGWDRLLHYTQNAYATDVYRLWPSVDRTGTAYLWNAPIALGEWQHVRAQFCGANGYSIVVTRRSDGTVVLSRSDGNADMRIPVDVTNMYVQLTAQGQGKGFDNLRVTRGCQ